jgi:hypothetical protein
MTKKAVWIVRPEGYEYSEAFRDVAGVLDAGLRDKGYDSTLVTGDKAPDCEQVIILGANLLPEIGHDARLIERAIIYNLEQITPESPWMNREYIDILRRFRVVDYSERNAGELRKLGIDCKVAPICDHPVVGRVVDRPQAERDIDVLLVGYPNYRREHIIKQLSDLGLSAQLAHMVFGEERDALLSRAKCVINIHFYEAKVLETVRLSYLLANSVFVVSEKSSDPDEDERFEGGVVFAEYDDLLDTTSDWLSRPAKERDAVAQTGLSIMQSWPIGDYIDKFLE